MNGLFYNTLEACFNIGLKGLEFNHKQTIKSVRAALLVPKIMLNLTNNKKEVRNIISVRRYTEEELIVIKELDATKEVAATKEIPQQMKEEVKERVNNKIAKIAEPRKRNSYIPLSKDEQAYKDFYKDCVYITILNQSITLKSLKGLLKNVSEAEVRGLIGNLELDGIISEMNLNHRRKVLVSPKYDLENPLNKLKFYIATTSRTAKRELMSRLRFINIKGNEFEESFDKLIQDGWLRFDGKKYCKSNNGLWEDWMLKNWIINSEVEK